MATTGFWPVKGNLKDVLNYAENPDKTTDKKFLDEDLWKVLQYAGNDQKTDQRMYVSGINCPPQRAYEVMMATKNRYGKLGGNVAYHGYQSFREGEVTPEEAHRIGMETAKRMWGEEYEILVTTHLNTDNIHNHLVLNSVSFRTGRKFENHISDHIRLREISDTVCREYGKSVLEGARFYGGEKGEYWARKAGKLNHLDMLRLDLNEAIAACSTWRDLERYLIGLGYRFQRDFSYEHPSVFADGWKQAVRIDSLGEQFNMDAIEEQLNKNMDDPNLYYIYIPNPKRTPLLMLERKLHRNQQPDALTAIFQIFVALLRICTGSNVERSKGMPLSPEMRAAAAQLERYDKEARLLCKNNIHTEADLLAYRDRLTEQINAFVAERQAIRNKERRASPEDKERLKREAKAITQKMKPLREQRQLCVHIWERSIANVNELLNRERAAENQVLQKDKKERSFER